MNQSMLTTTDNPYDPFDDFDNWLAYDNSKGYNTSGLLARITITSDELSEPDQYLAIDQAIDNIISENYLGIYKKVSKDINI